MAALMKTCVLNSMFKLCSASQSRWLVCNTSYRRYARFVRRRPIKVIYEDDENSESPHEDIKSHPITEDKVVREKVPLTGKKPVMEEDYFYEAAQQSMQRKATKKKFKLPDNIIYTTLEEGDKRCGPVIMAAKSRKLRAKENIILLEGKNIIIDAIYSGIEIQSIFFDKQDSLEGLPFGDFTANYYKIKSSHMKIWSDVTNPPGIMAICNMPESFKYEEDDQRTPVTLILENIRDSGTMGTLLRTAAAVGCEKVISLKGCVDIWEPKVLRSGAGSHFKTCIIPYIGWEEVGGHIPEDSFVLLADTDCEEEHKYEKMNKGARQAMIKAIMSIKPSVYTEVDEVTGKSRDVDETFLNPETVDLFQHAPLSISSLFDVDLKRYSHVTVIISSEKYISNHAKKLTFDNNGQKLYVPMYSERDSLNSGITGSVILYEAKRQLIGNMESFERENETSDDDP